MPKNKSYEPKPVEPADIQEHARAVELLARQDKLTEQFLTLENAVEALYKTEGRSQSVADNASLSATPAFLSDSVLNNIRTKL